MNGQLGNTVVNPWLASAIAFALITFFFTSTFFIMPHPLPTVRNISTIPRWADIAGIVRAVQVYAGLTLVNKVGAGPFMGITVTAALLESLAIDHYGFFRMDHQPLNVWGTVGGLLLIGGVCEILRD